MTVACAGDAQIRKRQTLSGPRGPWPRDCCPALCHHQGVACKRFGVVPLHVARCRVLPCTLAPVACLMSAMLKRGERRDKRRKVGGTLILNSVPRAKPMFLARHAPSRRGRSHSHLSQHSHISYACEQREKVRNKADAEEDGAQFETTEIQIFDPKYPDLGKRQFLWYPASPCCVFE